MKLYFNKQDVENLKNTSDERLKAYTKEVLAEAEKALEIEVLTEDKVSCDNGRSGNIHENYYDASTPFADNMLTLVFAYYYTEDEAYFEKAKAMMLMYSGYKKWHGKGYHGKSELNTMNFCLGMAYGYNHFADKLTAEERKKIVDGTYNLGIITTMNDWVLPGTKIHAIDTMGHNWWVAIVAAGGIATIAMADEIPNSDELIKAAADGITEWIGYKGNPINAKPMNCDNGAYYESLNYSDLSYREYLRFRYAYKEKYNESPFDDGDLLKKIADFYAKTVYFSDSGRFGMPFGDVSPMGTGKNEAALELIHAGVDSKELRWYLRHTQNHKAELMDLVAYSQVWDNEAEAPAEKAAFYENIGWAIWRDSYENDAVMLAVKCGDTWNHAHADAGSFILYKNGRQVIRDSGTCDYGNPLYVDYYVSSYAHNVVLFDGKGQDKRDFMEHARLTGKLYNFVNQDGFRYVAADATGPMSRYFRKHLRHILWLDGFILIYDDIVCHEKGELSFLLHADDDCGFKMLSPHTESETVGHLSDKPDESVKIKVFKMNTDDDCRAKFVSVITLDDSLSPKMEMIENGYKVTCGDTLAYINILSDGRIMHRNCLNVMDDYLTDAVIFTENKGKYGVVNGSVIRKGDKVILDTLTRVNGIVNDL